MTGAVQSLLDQKQSLKRSLRSQRISPFTFTNHSLVSGTDLLDIPLSSIKALLPFAKRYPPVDRDQVDCPYFPIGRRS
jgi:hypothetical protein